MTMAMELIRHIAGLYSGKAFKGDFTQIYITGNEIWMAQQILASHHSVEANDMGQAESSQGERIIQTAPERIYLIVGTECPRDVDFSELTEVSWCENDIDDGIEYVRADKAGAALARVAELEQERDAANSRLHEVATACATAEQQRDAALARLAELEQEPVYTKPSWADNYGWSGGYIDFKCATDVERLARHFEDLLDAVPEGPLYAAPVAQAGQVPEGIRKALERIAKIPSNSIDFHPSHMSRIAREALAAAPAQGGHDA